MSIAKITDQELLKRLDGFEANSRQRIEEYCALVIDAWERLHWLTFPRPRVGEQRSIDQNSLFHVWATEYAAHLLKKPKKSVSEGELVGMKRILKAHCYRDNAWEFLVVRIVNPFTGESKMEYRSSKEYKTGEMYQFLTWVQMKAASDGLVLESKGEYKHNQERQVA